MYNQPFNQPMMNNYTMQQASPIVWVQGIEQAKALNMPYNSKIAVAFDKDNDIMYITQLDEMSRPTTKAYTFSPFVEAPPIQPVSREEFEQLRLMVENMQPTKVKKGDNDNG